MKFANNRIAILIFFYFRKPCEHLDVSRKNSIFTERACGENQVKYDNVIWKYDWRNEKSASRIFYSEHRNKNSDTRIV